MEREPDVDDEEEMLLLDVVDDTLDDEEEAEVVGGQPTLTLVGHEARFQPLPALEAAGGEPPARTRSHGLASFHLPFLRSDDLRLYRSQPRWGVVFLTRLLTQTISRSIL